MLVIVLPSRGRIVEGDFPSAQLFGPYDVAVRWREASFNDERLEIQNARRSDADTKIIRDQGSADLPLGRCWNDLQFASHAMLSHTVHHAYEKQSGAHGN